MVYLDHIKYNLLLEKRRQLEKIVISNQKIEHSIADIPIQIKNQIEKSRKQFQETNSQTISNLMAKIKANEVEHDKILKELKSLDQDIPNLQLEETILLKQKEMQEANLNAKIMERMLVLTRYNFVTKQIYEMKEKIRAQAAKNKESENKMQKNINDLEATEQTIERLLQFDILVYNT